MLATVTLIGATLLSSCAADRRRNVRPINLPGWLADALYSQAVIASGLAVIAAATLEAQRNERRGELIAEMGSKLAQSVTGPAAVYRALAV